MALSFSVTVSGTPSELDKRAALRQVERENSKRAATVPPGTPLATTPINALAISYGIVMSQIDLAAHLSYAQQASDEDYQAAKARWDAATDAQRAAALAQLPTI